MNNTEHKSGFVNIVGNPNVGKSTLMNELVGERISIITNKSQTTRHRIMGIVNEENYQIVFSDTPGVLKPVYKLQESMRKFSESALVDADIMLYITDIFETPDKNEDFLLKVSKSKAPVLLIINKIDLTDQDKLTQIVETWEQRLPKAEIIPCSALTKFNVSYILKRIIELLPVGAPYYDKDQLTDKPVRFFVSEIIREKILLLYQKEIPYSTEVVIEEYNEEAGRDFIRALVLVNRDSQKGIIIGNKGAGIKKLGTESRLEIEKFLQKKVHLELYVKVSKDWRDNDLLLKQFGYNL
ncbi:MAG TPA: GTPase Era [Bacteroidales bacterium]|nr:GTPase Era [Bacteroidales bacterium]HPH16150.1 GTPase Era [Bacteroidales bacterium]HPM13467.1 GTPase Era [Bacteroidales bacterium]